MVIELSRMGTYHAQTDGENQDALCCGKSRDYFVISLSDGVSECREAKRGASIASQAITNLFLKKGSYFLEFDEEQIADFALSHILCELQQEAEHSQQPVIDYSSTVASVLVDKRKKRMLYSSSGCCVTTTRLAEKMVSVKLCEIGSMESVIICSDGAWREMFLKNRLKPEVAELLSNNAYDALKDFLTEQNCFDDFSFIALDMRHELRRNSA